ncbi:MAG: matrixin family metalloprotease [Bradymonadaceae bacterium]
MKISALYCSAAIFLCLTAFGCSEAVDDGSAEQPIPPSFPGGKGDLATVGSMSFEEFMKYVYCEPDTTVCVIDGDLAIGGGEEGLRRYYEERIELAHSALTVMNLHSVDSVWDKIQRFNLTYCVSDDFGDRKQEVIDVMDESARQWEEFAHVRFVYKAEEDHRCDNKNNRVVFNVSAAPSGSWYIARAFFPEYDRADREIRINWREHDGMLTRRANENYTLLGVMRHEIGHVLGFRHEHIRPEASGRCFENDDFRPITEYDSSSVMHYPHCGGDNDWGLEFSENDIRGGRFFYPNFDEFVADRCTFELDTNGHVRSDCAPVVREIVQLANTASFEILDEWVGLDRRGVEAIFEARRVNPFHDLDDLREMDYVKDAAVRKMYEYLYVSGRCPQEIDEEQRILETCRPIVNRILEFTNNAPFDTLDKTVGIDRRGAANIVAIRESQPFTSIVELWAVPYVKTMAMNKLYNYLYPN